MSNFVTGPLNLVRLEGEINGVKKVFYFFMDIHLRANMQMECDDIYSRPIKLFLAETFKGLKGKDHDFFVETFPESYQNNEKYVDFHIIQVRKLFSKIFKHDDKKNTVLKSTEFPNVRFHYMDIRGYLSLAKGYPMHILNDVQNEVDFMKNKKIYSNNLKMLADGLNIAAAKTYALFNALYPKKEAKKEKVKKVRMIHSNLETIAKYTEKEYIETINYIVDKLKNNYKNDKVKESIVGYIDNQLHDLFMGYFGQVFHLKKNVLEMSEIMNHKQDDLVLYNGEHDYFYYHQWQMSSDMLLDITEQMTLITEAHSFLQMMTMDLFFLRRALDKDYVQTGITYTGGDHSLFYILFLINKFDFKLTHANYCKEDIKKTNNIIKSKKEFKEIKDLFLPPELTQCIDISKFPELFN